MRKAVGALSATPYRMLNSTGTVKLKVPPGISAGGAGIGEARRTMATASSSRLALPDPPTRRAESTRPLRSMVKVTRGLPSSPAERAEVG